MAQRKAGWVTFAVLAGLFCTLSGSIWGQGASATLLGTVTDMSNAAIPDAVVTITNVQTGVPQTVTTDAQGRFRAQDLLIGQYDAQVAKAGFATTVRKGVTLTVGSQTVVDFALAVGQQQQTVTVAGEISQVETTNAAIGTYTSQQQMADLPLNGRNFEQLILLSAGVAPVVWNTSGFQGRALQYSVAGGRPEGQSILLDDENLQNFWNNGMGSVTGSSLGVEAIAEFQTLTNAYGAQFGGNGAVVNAVSKSGTNDFHGSAFDYLRNSALDARDFFSQKSGPPAFRRNQYGASLGGPVKKNKAFFFFDYEGIRQLFEENQIATVPNCAAPGVCTPNPSDSAATATAIMDTLAIFPKPTNLISATTGQVPEYGSQINHEDYFLTRLDYTISDKDSVFLRWYMDKAYYFEPFGGGNPTGGGPIPFWNEVDHSNSQFVTLEERHLFSPRVVNLARMSFTRPTKDGEPTTIASLTGPVPIGTTPSAATPLQFFPNTTGLLDGNVQIPGFTPLGGGYIEIFNLVQNRYTWADDILWTKGAHSLRFGASFDRSQANTSNPLKEDTIWKFSSFATFLAGSAITAENVPPAPGNYPVRDFRQSDFAPYFQDNWKLSPKLTVNLGVRWEFYSNPTVLHNAGQEVANILVSTGYTAFPNVFGSNPSLGNIDPRVGVAFDPFSDHKTSIRAGFGMFHDPISGLMYQIGLQSAPPWPDVITNGPTYPNPLVGASLAQYTATSSWNRSQNNTTPYVIQYNLNIQREIAPNTVLTLAYVGSQGVHLFTAIDDNPPIPTITNGVYQFASMIGGKLVTNPRINPNFSYFDDDKPISHSNYNSLQVLLNRRFSQNFQGQVNYTYSKCMDNGAMGISTFVGQNITPSNVENPYLQSVDRGVCSYDLTHVLRVNALYALPFHQNRVVDGWQITGVVSKYSGTPFNVYDGFDQVGEQGGDAPRPNYVAGCDPYAGAQTIYGWFNTACYSLQAPGTLGNTGRNTLRGPGFFNADIALLKDTRLTERIKMQFRAEFFNVSNHENFASPNTQVFSSSGAVNAAAARITATAQGSTPRQIQFALKFLF